MPMSPTLARRHIGAHCQWRCIKLALDSSMSVHHSPTNRIHRNTIRLDMMKLIISPDKEPNATPRNGCKYMIEKK